MFDDPPSYFLRCMCNRNYCNKGDSLMNYLTRIVVQDMGFEHLYDALKK
uniref:Uncharacterized protein n=1 Tax=Romanomermis culicivorax TaxID=13658 RepID=A0A915IG11_ROMCU